MIAADNIVRTWETATAADHVRGVEWYGIAAELAAELHHCPETAAGVIAAMSPMMSWRSNVDVARRIIAAHDAGADCPASGYGLTRNVRKAWAILDGADPLDVLSGRKVRAFYANIIGDPDAVTVDRWAVRIALGDPEHPGTVGDRDHYAIESAYREAAGRIGIAPRDLQAATWVAFRRQHGAAHHDPEGS